MKRSKIVIILLVIAVFIFVTLPGFFKAFPFPKRMMDKQGGRGIGFRDSVHPEIEFVSIPQECKSLNFTEFTDHITDLETIRMVVPPGTYDFFHGEKIIKTHSYIVGEGERPIYAPVDSIAFEGTKYLEEGMVQYSVFLMAGCDLMFMFDHIQKPVDKLLNEMEKVDNIASEDSRTSSFKKIVEFKSGELIGYSTGTRDAKHWDFGTYDLTKKNFVEKLNISNAMGRDTHATCPFIYFPQDMAKEYTSRFGNLRTEEAIPYTFCKENN